MALHVDGFRELHGGLDAIYLQVLALRFFDRMYSKLQF